MKSAWVSSAFGDLATTPAPKSTQSSQRPATREVSKRALANPPNTQPVQSETNSENRQPLRPLTSKVQPKTQQPARNNANSQMSLAEKYAPKSRAELVVHKAKVDQLSSLLEDIISRKKGSILLIDGPTGCGKTVIFKFPGSKI